MFLEINERKTRPNNFKKDDSLSCKERESYARILREPKVSIMSPEKRQSTPFFRKSRIVSESVKKKEQ